ncbi:putative helicase [Tetrabaena socialis]|uniref:Putative helicase n=1 Tax=Tetrabaena socialis TaxID=47790 RepID=A0A2J8A1T7_9CHLO|nr:putative helicase [Tetrabaena socialis]|eukprot:PNH06468.1 putative helicase [Tetrabaena socialis]
MSQIYLLHDLTTKRTGRCLEDYAPKLDLECARDKLSAPGHQFFEVLSTAKTPVTKFYLDRDQLLDSKPTDTDIAMALAEVHEKLADLLGGHFPYKIAQRHGFCPSSKGRYKLSFRPYIHARVRYTDIPDIVRDIADDGFWDLSVYKGSEQLLACPNGRKGHGDNRILRMEREDDDIADYLAQVTDDSWQLMTLPESPTPSPTQTPTPVRVEELDPELVRDALRCISATRAGKHDQWRNICFGLKSSGLDLLQDFKAFSRRAPDYDTRADQKEFKGRRQVLGSLALKNKEERQEESLEEITEDKIMDAARILYRKLTSRPTAPIASVLRHEVTKAVFDVHVLLDDATEGHLTLALDTLHVRGVFYRPSGSETFEKYLNDSEATALPVVGVEIASVHKDLPPDLQWRITRPTGTRAVFSTENNGAMIEVLNVNNPGQETANVKFDLKTAAIRKGQMSFLNNAYKKAIQNSVVNDMNMGWAIFYNPTVNIYNAEPSSESNRRPDDDLAKLVIQTHPDAFARIVFAPDVKTSNCNGLYFCDTDTNVWSQEHNGTMEEKVQALFKSGSLELTEKELHYVASRRGRADMLHIVACKLADKGFKASLDSKRDIFPVANGCFDMSGSRVTWRPLTPEDRVSVVAPWAYCPELAQEKRAEVDTFLAQVLPVAEERSVVLNYFANLLSGRRCAKKFLVLTDKSGGDNGKSTLLALFSLFFASFAETNTKFVCKGSFDRDRDSHDAGMEPMKGKRLIVAEELKHDMTLDDALLKRLTGGDGVTISGRQCGSSGRFEFTWSAGIVLLFNEGDCPKFDAGDTAFMGRMLVAPMRSKFVDSLRSEVNPNPYQFPMVANIQEKFPSWLPALADVFTEYFAPLELFNSVPPAMKEWRSDITGEANPLKDWLDETVLVTGNSSDVLLIADLKGLCHVRDKRFAEYVKGYFSGVTGVTFHAVNSVKVGETWATKRGVLKGVQLQ